MSVQPLQAEDSMLAPDWCPDWSAQAALPPVVLTPPALPLPSGKFLACSGSTAHAADPPPPAGALPVCAAELCCVTGSPSSARAQACVHCLRLRGGSGGHEVPGAGCRGPSKLTLSAPGPCWLETKAVPRKAWSPPSPSAGGGGPEAEVDLPVPPPGQGRPGGRSPHTRGTGCPPGVRP